MKNEKKHIRIIKSRNIFGCYPLKYHFEPKWPPDGSTSSPTMFGGLCYHTLGGASTSSATTSVSEPKSRTAPICSKTSSEYFHKV